MPKSSAQTYFIRLWGTAQELLDNHDVQRAYLGKDYKRIDEQRDKDNL